MLNLLAYLAPVRLAEGNPDGALPVALFLLALGGACYLAKRWGR